MSVETLEDNARVKKTIVMQALKYSHIFKYSDHQSQRSEACSHFKVRSWRKHSELWWSSARGDDVTFVCPVWCSLLTLLSRSFSIIWYGASLICFLSRACFGISTWSQQERVPGAVERGYRSVLAACSQASVRSLGIPHKLLHKQKKKSLLLHWMIFYW